MHRESAIDLSWTTVIIYSMNISLLCTSLKILHASCFNLRDKESFFKYNNFGRGVVKSN